MSRRLLWCLPVLLSACSVLADLGDERSAGAPDASAGSGGSGGGSAGAAGSGGSGGSAGAAGSAGSAGVAGSAGAAGSDASVGGSAGMDAGTDAPSDACGANLAKDPDNCGYCGHSCLGGDCVSGECQPVQLTTTQHGARGLTLADGNLFWGNIDISKVYMIDTSGGAPASWTLSVSGPSDVTTYGGYFYFAGKYDSKIHRLPTSGAQAPQTYWPTTGAVNSVAVDADGAYFDQPNAVAKSSGSSQTSLGTFPIQPRFLALDASYVYVTAEDAGEVHRIPRAGGSSQKLFSAGTSTWAITVDDQWVYFSTWVASEVLRGKKDGSGATQSIAAGQAGTFDMVISGNYLYWVNQGTYAGNYADGSVLRARIDGATPGVPEPLASQQDRPQGVAVDGQAVYWVCFGNGTNTSLPPGSVWKLAL